MATMTQLVWPQLRDELAIFKAPNSADGAPAWSLHDPVRNLFYRLDWATFEVLARWHLGNPQAIVQALQQETTLRVKEESVLQVAEFLVQGELAKRLSPASITAMGTEHRRRQAGWMTWLLHHYLFFRVPLWRPDAWLERVLPHVQWVFNKSFVWVTGLALAVGLYLVGQQWERFASTLVDFFSWQGLIAYAVTLTFVKFLHELGHGFTAKRYGCKVPVMGVAFLVMFPVAYTDVNDAWKLDNAKRRMAIDAAGIVTELVVAVWSTLAWALLPDGALRHGAFLLATTTWVSTVVINASPFMRFDGYFLLMDALDMPNLHQRAFAMARWRLREWLFGLGERKPEELPRGRYLFVLAFAYVTWLYRLVVFLGIAWLVYSTIPQPLGAVLGLVELVWFLGLPIWNEIKFWIKNCPVKASRNRIKTTLLILGGLGLVVLLPWDTRVTGSGLLRPEVSQPLVAPGAAFLETITVKHGQAVKAGDLLVRLRLPDLDYQQQVASARASGLQWRVENAGLEPKLQENQKLLQASLGKAEAEVAGLSREKNRYAMQSPIDGVVYWMDPDWAPGAWVRANAPIVEVADVRAWQGYAYLSEKEVKRVQVGDSARFIAESGQWGAVPLVVSRVDQDASHVLQDGILASVYGGEILVREKAGRLVPEQAIYRVTLQVPVQEAAVLAELAKSATPVLRGKVVISGEGQSWLGQYWRTALSVARRETGL
jgi:putative peptide zinc metalloprotease protein